MVALVVTPGRSSSLQGGCNATLAATPRSEVTVAIPPRTAAWLDAIEGGGVQFNSQSLALEMNFVWIEDMLATLDPLPGEPIPPKVWVEGDFVLNPGQNAKFCFNSNIIVVCIVDNLSCKFDIVIKRQMRTVDHHRGKTAFDARSCQIKTASVIKVQCHRNPGDGRNG